MPNKPSQYLILALLLSANITIAQNKTADSLQTVLKSHTKKDTARVNLLNKIASSIFTTEADKASKMLKESEALADELNYKKGKAFSLMFSGNVQINKANYPLALDYFKNALSIYETLKDKEGIANCSFNFGRSYFYLNDYDKAENYYKTAIALCEETGDLKRMSSSLLGIGLIYSKRGDYDKSMATYKKALQIDEKLGNKKGIANDLTNLGNLYKRQGDFALALDYFHRSNEIKEELGDQLGMAANYANIGALYEEIEKDKEALEYYRKAMPIYEKFKNPKGIATTSVNVGVILMNHKEPKAREFFERALKIGEETNDQFVVANSLTNLGTLELVNQKYTSALNYFERSNVISKQLGNKRELSYNYLKIGKIHHALKDFDKALDYANHSMELAKELKLIDHQRDVSLLLSDIYYDTKQYKLAFEKRADHKALNDSIYKREGIDKLSEVKYQYEFKDKLNSATGSVIALKDTVKEKDTALESSNQQKLWWIAGFVGLVAILGFVVAMVKIRKVKMENKQLLTEQKLRRSQMNPHFIFNSLQNVRSLINNKQQDEAVDYLNKFSKLTRQILESSDQNYTSLSDEIGLIRNYISIQQLLHNNAFDYKITVEDDIDTEATFLPPMLTQPFIENAIKHGLANKKEKGLLEVKFLTKQGKLFFEVVDNGNGFGITAKDPEHKSMAMAITKERLVHYTKNEDFTLQADNIFDQYKNIIGAKVSFEVPYIYEN